MVMEAKKEWYKLIQEINRCKKCELWKSKRNYVIGSGSVNASVMFVGEAPGKNEDLQGKPFVGRSGKFLDGMLNSIGSKREDVYIANTVKCRPQNNNDPKESEKKKCLPYLQKQLELIKPKTIVALGRHAMEYFFRIFKIPNEKIGKCHGKIYSVNTDFFKGRFIVMYHPAVAIYNKNRKEELILDFKKVRKFL